MSILQVKNISRKFGGLTAVDNVSFDIELAIIRLQGVRSARRDAVARAHELLEQVGLNGRANDLAQDLSFGEQRFLSIARTLAGDPTLILLDEPSVGLDGDVIEQLKRTVITLARERGKTILIIEHNLDVIFEISDQINLLVSGRIALSGTPSELKRHPTMIEAYLGDAHATLST
jgi:branched-chain amino acid transport system ATP-binding protein